MKQSIISTLKYSLFQWEEKENLGKLGSGVIRKSIELMSERSEKWTMGIFIADWSGPRNIFRQYPTGPCVLSLRNRNHLELQIFSLWPHCVIFIQSSFGIHYEAIDYIPSSLCSFFFIIIIEFLLCVIGGQVWLLYNGSQYIIQGIQEEIDIM